MKETELAFNRTTKLIFGKSLSQLSKYEVWLMRNLPSCKQFKTCDGSVIMPNISIYRSIPAELMAGLDYAKENSNKRLDITKTNFNSLVKELHNMGRIVCELREGTNQNMIESNFYLDAQDCYRIAFCFHSKRCAYNIWSSYNEYTFGCYRNMNGSFSINCYFSTELNRCFEMDSCKKCNDSMFCHNCEGLQDSMFCFNAKSLRYAIANVEVGREKYMQLKKMVIDNMLEELEKTSELKLSIYNTLDRQRK